MRRTKRLLKKILRRKFEGKNVSIWELIGGDTINNPMGMHLSAKLSSGPATPEQIEQFAVSNGLNNGKELFTLARQFKLVKPVGFQGG